MTRRSDGWVLALVALMTLWIPSVAWGQEVRLKDMVHIRGVRTNQVYGLGLVVGLNGSGDSKKSLATNRAAASMMSRLGMQMKEEEIVPGTMAIVMVTADLPPFARNGDKFDVKVSTVGDAKSLAGGNLVITPLRAADGKTYAVAQGSVVIGKASGSGTQVQTVATIPDAATVEREIAVDFAKTGAITLALKDADFTTTQRICDVINAHFRGFYAEAVDPSAVKVRIPPNFEGKVVEFVSEMESLKVSADRPAVVVLNERTGTVVMGGDVLVSPVSISHGDLSIQVGGKQKDSAGRETIVDVNGTSVGSLVKSLNAMGVKPADLVSILNSLKTAGALKADLRVM
ncbi:MAG: hypothetical protein RIQ81_821 [Pseudomonadota bacterium]